MESGRQTDFTRIELIVSDMIRFIAKANIQSENSEIRVSEFASAISSLEIQVQALYRKHQALDQYTRSLPIKPARPLPRKQFVMNGIHKKSVEI
ncbi:hypothetical protein CVD28_08670 [Bacillus sp. M6-12]|uniref:hypothetical protein n=1 Tax=Bacillus sp. M6-12 TaxID=2054166 RepID=UPI000C793F0F|nr:hypothetical protein [Bacillus sp. M6-12]PLS17765.1 hypothetical protein CVD28_08670 [Bacillus sp. M6-12]